MGFTLNLITLLALTLAVGIVNRRRDRSYRKHLSLH
jgi:hypothetical protein